MNKLNNFPDKLPESIISRAQKLNSSLISDAMGGENTMDYKIKPVGGNMDFVGTALTISTVPGDNLFIHHSIYNSDEGYVLVVDGKSHTKNAYLGELLAAAAKAAGLEAIVIDGLVRDKSDLQKIGFPIYARGFIPSGPTKNGPGEKNLKIICGGAVVNPGDLVIGDQDGVAVVPRNQIDQVLAGAEKKQKYEKQRLRDISLFSQNKTNRCTSKDLEPDWLEEKMAQFKE
ncbi:RraA family protein [Alkalihalophilus marmarensis]|jgi:RraA family protein|uniref:Putative 4-hydroxy-4-methyl-2-oxoglutarate aldolase n=1 Tax=Alkalihalophilus marmarensis DSM 21297 TaxID=1188261 RepID=U6SKX7_9BACI|nr:hypothetical protein [Alkalihalophilus marmarensis]ERN51296.1 hypothetical protein A33I_20670 [Alkalihalophilus marmarensis DSM 21297]MCM3491588.1 RraA family protein [Alkalihalophilus marmarensis]